MDFVLLVSLAIFVCVEDSKPRYSLIFQIIYSWSPPTLGKLSGCPSLDMKFAIPTAENHTSCEIKKINNNNNKSCTVNCKAIFLSINCTYKYFDSMNPQLNLSISLDFNLTCIYSSECTYEKKWVAKNMTSENSRARHLT